MEEARVELVMDRFGLVFCENGLKGQQFERMNVAMTETLPMLYQNRELSWLKFNQRVLEQAVDPAIPLLERMKFISIFSNNLDEFFMIRVGTLTDAAIQTPDVLDNKSLMTPAAQLENIFVQARELLRQKDEAVDILEKSMSTMGLEHLCMDALDEEQAKYLYYYFTNEIQPMLSPQIIDKHHPFPFLKNKETYICTQLRTKGEFVKLAIIPVSTDFDRIVFLPYDPHKYVLLEELVYQYCSLVFDSYEIVDKTVFRITRNADINVDEAMYDHDIDYRSVMEEMVKNRRKLMPVRIEFQHSLGQAMLEQLCAKLELSPDRIFYSTSPLDMSYGFALCSRYDRMGKKELFYPVLTPQMSGLIDPKRPITQQVEARDILLSYPFESMKPFISLLIEAAEDETVISIKMTLYRVARESQIVAALIKAAENGKEVHVVVELRARFDEENNIIWSKRLEEAGVNVIYGLGQFKVHSKLLVITRKREDKISFITQVGTGNYNESTAKLYTDLCLITANREFGEEGLRIFNGILTDNPTDHEGLLLAAPLTIKPRVLEYIDREIAFAKAGEPAEMIIKINSLTDKDIIDRLIGASMAGVKVRMIIRGICCLRVGVEGYTDNIEVISVVGRFLEHSRVYVFGMPERRMMYISSADFMTRNMERRVEVAAPILDEQLQRRVMDMLELEFHDNMKAQRLLESGEYVRVKNGRPPTDSQIDLYKFAYARAERKRNEQLQKSTDAKAGNQRPVQNRDKALSRGREVAKQRSGAAVQRTGAPGQKAGGTSGQKTAESARSGLLAKLKGLFRRP